MRVKDTGVLLMAYFIEQSSSQEYTDPSTSKEIPRLLRSPKLLHPIQHSPLEPCL
jgi:hypothetical protein